MNWAALALVLMAAAYGWRRFMRMLEKANKADWGGKWLNRLDGLNRIFCRRFHRLRHQRLHLPQKGGALLASNHVSGLDPLLLIAASRRPLRFMIAREEYDRWYLRWLFQAIGCIPVERSRNPRAAFHAARAALEKGEIVALFPHGKIHLDHHPHVPLKRGIAVLAQYAHVPIIPARVEGVRGQGLTVPAVVMRSRVRVRSFAPLRCHRDDDRECLEVLERLITTGSKKLPHVHADNAHRRH